MAANKRKQDEKHLKILREMVALPHNKQCLDCHQRGPTYINMTIGSFVCTSCSGILRGLNPPHRVKSISMTSFTPEEMEFLKSRGNSFCRSVWLGLYDTRTHMEPDSKDESKIRDFMTQKYEKKRWYVAPTEAMHEEARKSNTPAAKTDSKTNRPLANNIPQIQANQQRIYRGSASEPVVRRPISSALRQYYATLPHASQSLAAGAKPALSAPPGSKSQSVQRPVGSVSQNNLQITSPNAAQPPSQIGSQAAPAAPTSSTDRKPTSFDLLGELGGDPFASPAPSSQPQGAASAGGGGGFADFANFGSNAVTPSGPAAAAFSPATQGFFVPQHQSAMTNVAPQSSAAPFAAFPSTTPAATTPASNTTTPSGDKYSALAELDSVFGETNKTVNWNGNAPSTASSSGGANVLWGDSNGGNNSGQDAGFTQTSNTYVNPLHGTSSSDGETWLSETMHECGSNPFLCPVSNPFGGNTMQTPSSTVGNPFMSTSANAPPTQTGMGHYGQQSIPTTVGGFGQPAPMPGVQHGFGQFGTATTPSGSAPGQFGMQNGGYPVGQSPGFPPQGQHVGFPAAQQPGGYPAGQQQPGFGGQNAGWGFAGQPGGQMNAYGGGMPPTQGGGYGSSPGQYGGKVAPAGYGAPPPQDFSSWGAQQQSVRNPFMMSGQPEAIPPRGSSTNPFL